MSLDPITAGIDAAKTIVDKIWPDAGQAERDKIQAILAVNNAQAAIAQAEASNPSVFVAGARPFILWVCGASLVYTYLAYPLLLWANATWGHVVPPPLVNGDHLYELMMGMLGLGGMRTYEKVKGVA